MNAQFFSEWNTPTPGVDAPYDLAKHAAFVEYALATLRAKAPEVLDFLNMAGAKVIVGPKALSIKVSSPTAEWVDLHDIAAHLNLLPWAEPHETVH